MKRLPFALLGVMVLLAACGGGGDDDEEEEEPDDANPAGYFLGTMTLSGGSAVSGNVLVTEDGRYMALVPNLMYVIGTGNTVVTSFSASGNALRLPFGATFPATSAPSSPMSFTGTVTERSSLTGSFSGGGLLGNFTFNSYQAATYERAASTTIAGGVYPLVSGVNGTQLITTTDAVMTVSSAGALTYNTTTGCTGNGTLTAPFPTRNYYSWTLNFTNCSNFSSTFAYSGLAFMIADPTGNFRVLNFGGATSTTPTQFFLFQGAR